MNPRTKLFVQKTLAFATYLLVMLIVVLALVPLQYPDWWPRVAVTFPNIDIPWWPVVRGIGYGPHYAARIFLTIAFGLTIFLPQVETTFVSLMRRQSPIGSPYADRKDFACPVCGTVNRPSVQFCVKCGTEVYLGTRHWGQPRRNPGLESALKIMLTISAFLAFFLGLFDLTIYFALTGYLGMDAGTILAATIISAVPSLAGYVALKEGPFRRYGSLKQFDKFVFGDAIWIAFGLFFIILAAYALIGPPPSLAGTFVVLTMQVLLGAMLILHPIIRRNLSRPITAAYTR